MMVKLKEASMKSLLSLVLLAPVGLSQGHVIVVDAAGAGAYTEIGRALQHAAAGDVLLVKSGTYSRFVAANQSIAIVGDTSATVQVNGTVQVTNLAAGGSILLHRLQAFGAPGISPNDGPGISLANDVGAVRIQECIAHGAAGRPGVQVESSGDVALASTQALGGIQWPASGDGVLANGSAIAVCECDLRGGDAGAPIGYQPPQCSGGAGGSGLRSGSTGFVFVGGSLLRGANGTNGLDGCGPRGGIGDWCYGGWGGSGIALYSGVQTVWQLGNILQFGVGGNGGFGQCGCGFTTTCYGDSGYPGLPVWAEPVDTLVDLAGASPTLTLAANPVRENTIVLLAVDSAPGDAVLLVGCSGVGFAQQTDRGVRLVDTNGPHFTRRLGTTNSLGHLQASWSISDLGAGVESQIVHLQVLVVRTNGQRRWSNPVSAVLLDSAF